MTLGLSLGVQEFAQDSKQFLPPWVLYFSCTTELERFLSALNAAWRNIYQVSGRGSGAAVLRPERGPAGEASLSHGMWDSEPGSPGVTGHEHPGLARGAGRDLRQPRPPLPPRRGQCSRLLSRWFYNSRGEVAPVCSPPDGPTCMFQVDLLHKAILDAAVKKKCEDAQSLIDSAWQRSDSLCRGRAERDPWC